MTLAEQQRKDLNIALNEALLLNVEVNTVIHDTRVTIRQLVLPEEGVAAQAVDVRPHLHPIGRVADSLRQGIWINQDAVVESCGIEELSPVVRNFGGEAVHGWNIFDVPTINRNRTISGKCP